MVIVFPSFFFGLTGMAYSFEISVYFFDATTGGAVGDEGTILSTPDGGKTWTAAGGGTTADLWSVHFVDATDADAV